jgi:hypothetical protein
VQIDITPSGTCNGGDTECFHVVTHGGEGNGRDANITHIFVNTGMCTELGDPTVTGVSVGPALGDLHEVALHTQGGPCQSIDRVVWFPLSGNQSSTFVCVTTSAPAPVTLSAKAKGTCTEGPANASCCITTAPDAGAGGAGGCDGGAGGCDGGVGGCGGAPPGVNL